MLPMEGAWVQSLAGALRSYHAAWPKKKKNSFNTKGGSLGETEEQK